MSSVDNRIVTMQFDNRSFKQEASTTLSLLQKLKESLNFGTVVGGAVRSLGAIDSAISKIGLRTPFSPFIRAAQTSLGVVGTMFDKLGMRNPFERSVAGASDLQSATENAAGSMGRLEGGVTAVSAKFVALSTIAITALSNITNRAISSGTNFLKSFTFAPINEGLQEYELNLKSIQTIQANTDRPLPVINKALDELNKYADLTIYNFGEMARNIGTFTAAGVGLETSVAAIKGIANMAALSGSNSQQASTAMYQLSQALASGKVGLQDWNSVVNAGMGGKKLQNALAQTAIAMGEIDAAQVKGAKSGEQLTIMGNSFRESIMASPGQESWLTSKILENSLASLDGRYSVAALQQEKLSDGTLKYKTRAEAVAAVEKERNEAAKKGIVYTDEQFKALQKLSTSAFESATKVKTLGQVFEIAKETMASGWSASFRNIFGNLKEAKKLFTGMSEGLSGIIDQNAIARNEVLSAWKKQGGRDTLIDGLTNAWTALKNVMGPVIEGFRDIFPAKSASDLVSMTKVFERLTESLIPGEKTMANIRETARGFFSIFGIAKTILGGVVTAFATMFSVVGGGNGSFLEFVSEIANMITRFHTFLQTSGLVTTFFTTLGKILAVPINLIQGLASILASMFGGFDNGAADAVGEALDGVGNRFEKLGGLGEYLMTFFTKVGEFFGNLGSHIANALSGIGDVIAGAFTADTFGATLDVINTTLLGGIVLLFKNFFSKGVNIDLSGGLFDGIKETLGAATGAFNDMQNTLKADILLKLAGAIAVMTGALLVLSMIDPKSLSKALAAMTGGFAILTGALVSLMKFMGPAGLVQMYVVTSAITRLSVSILLLALSLKVLSSLKFGEMMRGLVGLGITMKILSKAMIPMAAGSKGMLRAAAALVVLGVALNLIAVSLKIFATMSWEEMVRGLLGMTGALIGIAVAMKLMPDLNAEAVTLLALAGAMILLGVAMKIFASMTWEEMVRGLLALVGGLAIIAGAMRIMPKGMLLQAAALVVVANAMLVLSAALVVMGNMGWEAIAKGLIVLAASLAIIAAGLYLIGPAGIIGAAGLLVTVVALNALLPVLLALGAMSWESILKSLVMLAGVFTILGVAAFVLAPLVPVILGLAAAVLILGAGMFLIGAGMAAASLALATLVAAGAVGAQVLLLYLESIGSAIPAIFEGLALGIISFIQMLGTAAPQMVTAFANIIGAMLDAVSRNIPKMARLFNSMLNAAISIIGNAIPKIITLGIRLILSFLGAIDKNIGRIADIATSIIIKFMDAIGRNQPKLVDKGAKTIIKLIDGMSAAIRNNSDELGRAAGDLGIAIIEGLIKGINSMAGQVKDRLVGVAKDALQSAKDFLNVNSPSKRARDELGKPIPEGMALGVDASAGSVRKSVVGLASSAMGYMKDAMNGIGKATALDTDFSPTITPILDLSNVVKEASKLGDILTPGTMVPTLSHAIAADISARRDADAQREHNAQEVATTPVSQQNNLTLELHSPKPIDSVEAYRAGKTLIAITKEAIS